jgi:hypothetical protein
MHHCPHCSSTFVRLVRPTLLERVRFRFTDDRPHECWHCGWRGWLPLEEPQAEPPSTPGADWPDRPSPTASDASGVSAADTVPRSPAGHDDSPRSRASAPERPVPMAGASGHPQSRSRTSDERRRLTPDG